jgi:hypothetical protein
MPGFSAIFNKNHRFDSFALLLTMDYAIHDTQFSPPASCGRLRPSTLATLFSPEEGDDRDGARAEGNCPVGSAMVSGTSRKAAPLPMA